VEASEAAVREFIARINGHDVDGIVALSTPEHRFVDGLGQVLTGHDPLRAAWSAYLKIFPDYRIEIESLAVAGALVLAAGSASGSVAPGTPQEQHWRIPAAWRAQVKGDLIDAWQVYADNTPVFELLKRNQSNQLDGL
jgi:ketosteroid isomerase-like protein